MKEMKKRGKGKNMFGIFGMMKVHMLFKPFSSADANGDMKVTPMEMGEFMNKMSRKVCRKYKMEQKLALSKKWMEAGMPAEELAKMKAKKEEMKKKWSSMKKKWADKKKDMKKRGGKGKKSGKSRWADMKKKWAAKAKAWRKNRDEKKNKGKN